MRRDLATVLVAAGVVGLAGCGGSSHSSTDAPTQPAVIVHTVGQGGATTTTTTATKPKKPQQHTKSNKPARSQEASTTHVTTINGLPGITIGKTTTAPAAPPVSGAKSAVGFMSRCLSGAGLARVQLLRPNEWRGVAPSANPQPVYVDGPFKTRSAAATSAGGLLGIESVAAGGFYVVSGVLHHRLGPYVTAAAKCLAKAGNAPSGQKPIAG
jgi:hypothetical protein